MKSVALTAYPRTQSRRPGARRVRAAGRIPAVIYGTQRKSENLEVGARDLENVIHGAASETVLVDLSLDGSQRLAIIQSVQHEPLSGRMLHVDFHEVQENEKVTVTVPIETEGEAAGVKTGGGILEHVLFKIKVRGLPRELPDVIRLDVTHLEIGQSIHLNEVPVPPGVEVLGHKEVPVVSVAAPVSEAEEAAALETAAAGPAEPEMIKEKKEETAEGEAAAKAPEKGAEKAEKKEKAPAEKKK